MHDLDGFPMQGREEVNLSLGTGDGIWSFVVPMLLYAPQGQEASADLGSEYLSKIWCS